MFFLSLVNKYATFSHIIVQHVCGLLAGKYHVTSPKMKNEHYMAK